MGTIGSGEQQGPSDTGDMDFGHKLDLATVLNAISTLAIVMALVFTGLQVRQGNQSRVAQAAIAVIQSSQNDN